MKDVSAFLPNRPDVSTIWRWTRRGVLAPDGTRIRLKTLRAGRTPLIRRTDLDAFLAACAGVPAERGSSERLRKVELEAESMGV